MSPPSSFWWSYAVLGLVQGLLVALPRARALPLRWPRGLRSRWWALVPLASIVGCIAAIRAAAGTADGLTYLALVAGPPLTAATLGWSMHGARRWLAVAVVPLFAVAWAAHGTLAGQVCALALTSLGTVTLGTLLTAVTPLAWLKAGVVAMCAADVALVTSHLLQAPNDVLNAAAPAASLPQLQDVSLGTAVMGYGDVFLASVLGAILVAEGARQGRIALVTAVFALLFGLLFLVLDELPATVPVAAALGVSELARRRGRRRRPAPAPPARVAAGAHPAPQ